MHRTIEIAKKLRAFQLGTCLTCGTSELVTDTNSGEVACSQCGLVIKDAILNRKPEWRAFTLEEKKARNRTGSPMSLTKFDMGLSTTFQPYKDANGRLLPLKQRHKMIRLRKRDQRTKVESSASRNLAQAMTELHRLTGILFIPLHVIDEAALIYRKILNKGLIRGRSIAAMAAASLYASCRLTKTPRSLYTIAEASTRDQKEIARSYRLIHRELNLTIPIDNPTPYIPKIASQLGLNQQTQNRAIQLLRQAKNKGTTAGKGPKGLAAAALYIAVMMRDQRIPQREFAKAAGVTEVTIRNRYKGLEKTLRLRLRSHPTKSAHAS